ncbi:MAG: hypothetical protein AB7O65_11960 [Candidatus Korobacteraceae bacterium]
MLKLLAYVVLGFVALAVAGLLITQGQAPASHPVMLFAFVALFGIPPVGALWMIYLAIRHEKNPFPMVLLALIPFSFLWYYFERVHLVKLDRNRNSA